MIASKFMRVLWFGLGIAAVAAWLVLGGVVTFSGMQVSAEAAAHRAPSMRVALFINGVLGDKSFFDSAARGLRNARDTLGIDARTIEGGVDPIRWEEALTDLADSGDFDVIIAGTFTIVPYIEKLAPQYPKTRFIVFDASVNYAACDCRNVYSILFRQSEGAYLAGVLAARLVQQPIGDIPAGSSLGMIGGMPIPVIDDFLIGFKAGANSVAPKLGVMRQYANSFSDPATGKEIAKAQYGQGAGVIFQAAGATGQGVVEAAVEAGRYMIAVDSDQVSMYQASNPQRAARVVTSVMKNVDVAILRALQLHQEGALRFGAAESLGLKERGISLANNAAVLALAGPELAAELDKVESAIVEGRTAVPSVFENKGGGVRF